MRTAMKKVEAAIVNNDLEAAKQLYAEAAKKLDKAGFKKVLSIKTLLPVIRHVYRKMNAMNEKTTGYLLSDSLFLSKKPAGFLNKSQHPDVKGVQKSEVFCRRPA